MADAGQRATEHARSAMASARDRFASRWADAVVGTSYVPMSAAEVRAFLGKLAERLTEAVLGEPFAVGVGREVGRSLVEAHFIDPDALQRTLRVLGTQFPSHIAAVAPHGAVPSDLTGRIASIQGAIAAGYAEALRRRILDEQELIRQAMLLARQDAERRLQARLRHQAHHDPLTQLPNRTLFYEHLTRALNGIADRIGLCYLDLDGFKVVNDSLGHDIGDELLVAVADRLNQSVVRAGHLVARMGGDEFVILVDRPASTTQLIEVANRTIAVLSDPFAIGGHQLSVSASIGIVERATAGASPADLMKAADITLYRAKSEGGDRWALYDPERNARDIARYTLSATMPAALEREEFYLDYQPLVQLPDEHVNGVEALVRWRHPEHGSIPPGKFIGLAEETGLIVSLGRWVLEQACWQAKAWSSGGGQVPLLSVNLAVRQLRDRGLVADIRRILSDTGMPPEYLQLEVTESAVMGSAGDPLDALFTLADMGIRIAVDDFGTGYSNLAYLRRLPLHTLKIDGSFIAGLDATTSTDSDPGYDTPTPSRRSIDDPKGLRHRTGAGIDVDPVNERIVSTLVDLAHTLDLSVTAEGVQTRAQAERLKAFGCDTAQGWYFGRPLPPDQVSSLFTA